jgi:glutamyl-tRNA reductase
MADLIKAGDTLAAHCKHQRRIRWRCTNTQVRYAFVGLGEMGRRMATNLARWLKENGHAPLIVYNRSAEGTAKFKTWASEKGVHEDAYIIVDDLAEVVKV